MYQEMMDQLTVYDLVSPFREALSPDNRWVKLAEQIDWRALEEAYASHFAQKGKQAIGVRCAFGSLVIKKALDLSDLQTVLLIEESFHHIFFFAAFKIGHHSGRHIWKIDNHSCFFLKELAHYWNLTVSPKLNCVAVG